MASSNNGSDNLSASSVPGKADQLSSSQSASCKGVSSTKSAYTMITNVSLASLPSTNNASASNFPPLNLPSASAAYSAPSARMGPPVSLLGLSNSGSTSQPQIYKQGWLFKRGEHIKNWRQRYFLLYDNGIFLGYKQEPKDSVMFSEPLNRFTICGCQILKTDKIRPNAFVLKGIGWGSVIERTFCAQTPRERDEWCDAIKYVSLMRSAEPQNEPMDDAANSPSHALPSLSVGPSGRRVTFDDFVFLTVLGKGTFGKVILSREKATNALYAIKIIKKNAIIAQNEVAHTLTENRVLRRTSHPFLIKLKYAFQTEERLCFVMEYMIGGELFYHLSRERSFSEARSRFYACEILLAIEYLHENGIIYRDLKLENLLLDREGHVKISDFGLCKERIIFGSHTQTFCGTPEYLAPEVLEDSQYGRAVDWWGLGIVLYEMMVGRLPFYSKSHEVLFEQILDQDVCFPQTLSIEAQTLIEGLLMKSQYRRLGAGIEDAKEIKSHPFFSGVNWEAVLARQVVPQFIPQVTSDTDTRYFDSQFISETPQLTPPENEQLEADINLAEHNKNHFKHFSYHEEDFY